MHMSSFVVLLPVFCASLLLCAGAAVAAEKLEVLVVVGGHGYEEKAFQEMFDSFGHLNCTRVELSDESEIFEDISTWSHPVIVLYNMTQKISEKRRQNFLSLLDKGVGLVVLHHAMANYPDWPEYRKIIGAKYWLEDTAEKGVTHVKSQWKEGVDMPLHVEDSTHPILAGVQDFVLHDETYKGYDLEPDNHLLLSCSAPTSQREVAWTRTYGKAKVCCIQPGHGAAAYGHAHYRRMVAQAIKWAAAK